MATSLEGEEIASYVFEKRKHNRSFIYEMKLCYFDITKQYCVLRRWYYADVSKKPPWRRGSWTKTQQKTFDMKVVQKRDIMKYRVLKEKDKRDKKAHGIPKG